MRGRPTLAAWFLLPLLLSSPVPSVLASDPDPSSIVRDIKQGRYGAARDRLHRLLFSEAEPIWKRRALYLLGHVHLKAGAHDEAARYFERAQALFPALSDYALYNLGLAEAGAGRYGDARRAFTALLGEKPESRLRPHALFQRAEAAFAADSWEEARPDYKSLLEGWPAFGESPTAHLRLGQVAEAKGQEDEALASFKAAVLSGPAHPAAAEALDRLDALWARLKRRAPRWSAEEALRLGHAWMAKGRPREALSALEVAQKRAKRSLTRGRAALGAAKAEVVQGRRESAAKRLRRFIRRSPRHPDVPEAHYIMGRALWNLNRRGETREVLRSLLHRYRESPFSKQAFYILGRLYAEQRSFGRSAKAFRELAAAYPDSELAREGLWRIGWNAYRRGRYGEAAAGFRRALSSLAPTDWEDEVTYWLARAYEVSEKRGKALGHYRELVRRYPHTYYGQRAAWRLMRLGEPASGVEPPVLSPARAEDGALGLTAAAPLWRGEVAGRVERALELAAMGFGSDARHELALAEAALPDAQGSDLATSFSMAALYHRAGLYGLAIRRLNGPFASMAPEEVLRLDRRFWNLYYPRPYLELIKRESAAHGLEPALVLGLIRQESAFRAEAVSPAGAEGLMQLLPGRKEAESRLFDPEVNIARGTEHLARLIKRYDGRLVDALVAYNAGVRRLERWRRRFKGLDEDEFIEAIPFSETRTYVKRVLRNAALYRMLYPKATPAASR